MLHVFFYILLMCVNLFKEKKYHFINMTWGKIANYLTNLSQSSQKYTANSYLTDLWNIITILNRVNKPFLHCFFDRKKENTNSRNLSTTFNAFFNESHGSIFFNLDNLKIVLKRENIIALIKLFLDSVCISAKATLD